MRRHSDRAYQQACTRLYGIIEKNGVGLHRISLNAQSAALASLFLDLSSDQSTADLQTIQATDWLSELQADQVAFDTTYAERNVTKGEANIVPDAEAFKRLRADLESLHLMVNALLLGNQETGIAETIKELNTIIDRFGVAK